MSDIKCDHMNIWPQLVIFRGKYINCEYYIALIGPLLIIFPDILHIVIFCDTIW